MSGEITRKSVLIECLQIMREELNICSSKYNGLEPKKGMEEAWEQARVKVKILEDLIHAYESEKVREALANWHKEEFMLGFNREEQEYKGVFVGSQLKNKEIPLGIFKEYPGETDREEIEKQRPEDAKGRMETLFQSAKEQGITIDLGHIEVICHWNYEVNGPFEFETGKLFPNTLAVKMNGVKKGETANV